MRGPAFALANCLVAYYGVLEVLSGYAHVTATPATIMIALSVAIFVWPEPLLEITGRAATGLLDHTEYIEAVIGR
mgnify:CR=1 FL=1